MSSLFTHAIVGASIACVIQKEIYTHKFAFILMILAVLPDIDVIAFVLGIPYAHPIGHRGFTHSLLFAAVLALATPFILDKTGPVFSRSWWQLASASFFAVALHGVLDAMTDAGLGIGFFIPFDNTRFFLPWRPLETSPIGITVFFNERGLAILKNEALLVWIPLLILVLTTRFVSRK